MCQVCSESGKFFKDGICQDCPEVGPLLTVPIVLFVVAILISVALLALHQNWLPQLPELSLKVQLLVFNAKEWIEIASFLPKLKIGLAFAQVVATLERTYDIGLPDSWFQWTEVKLLLGI